MGYKHQKCARLPMSTLTSNSFTISEQLGNLLLNSDACNDAIEVLASLCTSAHTCAKVSQYTHKTLLER